MVTITVVAAEEVSKQFFFQRDQETLRPMHQSLRFICCSEIGCVCEVCSKIRFSGGGLVPKADRKQTRSGNKRKHTGWSRASKTPNYKLECMGFLSFSGNLPSVGEYILMSSHSHAFAISYSRLKPVYDYIVLKYRKCSN